ncbi:peptidase M23 [Exiguobacterium sp. U13-1]|uniref:Peptidoglycan DD-metalloendopeptidase family protein n=1 Tax=Exiguobacterium acetylicum TaxID=41170 RepID=A0ABX8G7X2_EXIAC|nr:MULTISPECIES: M23 family metallopeptidase [Exiguobacterium]AOT01586.1 peptidase M23 [Exiguobacterium sp. U13-1]QWB29541.1 peptidoglycan DD-metalloendopeptidase family protein [Exiguobacterium acetylicum]HCD58029.1 peptidase M23 [Exiguobacterium sp.]
MKVRFYSAVLSLALIGTSVSVDATSKEDLLKEQQEVESRLKETERSQNQTSEKLILTKQERKEARAQLDEVNSRLDDLALKIADQQAAVAASKEQLRLTEEAISETLKELHQQEDLLGSRLRAVQQKGDVKYIEVLLDAKDFGDLISRFSTVSEIIKQDDNVLQAYKANVKQLNEQRSEQALLLESMKQEQRKLLVLQTRIIAESDLKRKLVVQLNTKVKELQQEQFSKAEEAEILADQRRLIQNELIALQEAERKAKEEAKRKAEEAARAAEAKRQAEAAKAAEAAREAAAKEEQGEAPKAETPKTETSVPEIEAPSATPDTSVDVDVSRPFHLPVKGYVSSPFGPRNNPLTGKPELHTGIDLVNAKGTPIHAAAGGIVLRAGSATGYGNVVMVTHLIDRQVYTTVYAHLDSISVSAGQTVMPGQTVGTLGSTGWSTGPHLHFELHKGEWAVGQPNAVDPAPYIF